MTTRLIQHRYRNNIGHFDGVAEGSVRLIFVDPPYNFGVTYKDDPTGDKLDPSQYRAWCRMVMLTLRQYLMPGGTMWWLCPAAHHLFVPHLLEEVVGPQEYMIIKEESFAQYQQKTLTEDFRLLFCHRKPGCKLVFNPDDIRIPSERLLQKTPDKRADPRGRVPGQMWKVRRLQGTSDDRVDWHPCQLPPELLHRIIKGWSNEGDTVLDAFAGSGNMGLAARLLRRDSVLVEGSETYCTEIKKRLKL